MNDRIPGATWDNPIWHRGFRIYLSDYEGFCYCHDDYDGAPDANDNRAGVCMTVEDCIAEINELWPDLDKLS